jgi:hypothetical protein
MLDHHLQVTKATAHQLALRAPHRNQPDDASATEPQRFEIPIPAITNLKVLLCFFAFLSLSSVGSLMQ